VVDLERYLQLLRDAGVAFATGVPDTLLNDLCLALESGWPRGQHVIAANEGNAIALATGHHLATAHVPLVYMQNSGLGNAMNPLISLADPEVYAIPMVLLIGWRGDPGSSDWPQHKRQGELTPRFLDDLNIPYRVIDRDDETAFDATRWAVDTARRESRPTALLARKRVFERGEKTAFERRDGDDHLSREEAIAHVLDAVPANSLCVATTGRATRELHELRNIRGEHHDNDFLNVGAMGHALSIATGMALAKPDRQVVCFDGDGAAIMHLGSLAIAGSLPLPNLLHVVLNNGAHESVGGQATAALQVDLTALARGAGYRTVDGPVTSGPALLDALRALPDGIPPGFIEVRIRKGIRADLPKLKISPIAQKLLFMQTHADNGVPDV
jgi:phosphonopyruvate decarboxylase